MDFIEYKQSMESGSFPVNVPLTSPQTPAIVCCLNPTTSYGCRPVIAWEITPKRWVTKKEKGRNFPILGGCLQKGWCLLDVYTPYWSQFCAIFCRQSSRSSAFSSSKTVRMCMPVTLEYEMVCGCMPKWGVADFHTCRFPARYCRF